MFLKVELHIQLKLANVKQNKGKMKVYKAQLNRNIEHLQTV